MEEHSEELRELILRYVDEYHWGWGVIRGQIRHRCGLDLTAQKLQNIYKTVKNQK
nr:MAG TPA: hypothetical protein [Caudoviricetes sp.]